MHRELEWPVSKATCLYARLYMVYINLYKIIEGTRANGIKWRYIRSMFFRGGGLATV